MDIILKSKIKRDAFVDYVAESYDIQDVEESVTRITNNLYLPETWNIGVIYGGSGTGKSTLLRTFGEIKTPTFDPTKSLISNFDFTTPENAANILSSMGLASVPSWLRPFHTLSNGEQDRARIAWLIGSASNDEVVLIDEFTSVVDRDVAAAMSNSIFKYVQRTGKRVVLASCHFDIMEWIQPNWIYSPIKGRVEIRDCLRRRPQIQLEVFRCRYETWNVFKQHHYLTHELNKAAKCYCVTWNDKPVAFIGILPFPSGWVQNAFRVSRLVVLPDFQGLGIGFKLLSYVCSLYVAEGMRMYIKTSNPGLGEKLVSTSSLWRETSKYTKEITEKSLKTMSDSNIWTMKSSKKFYAAEYIGKKSTDSTDVIVFNADAWRDVAQNQISLF